MSNSADQTPESAKPVISGRLRVEPWDAKISSHPQLKLFCDPDNVNFLSPSANPKPPHNQNHASRSSNSANMNDIIQDILSFREFGKRTQVIETTATTFAGESLRVPTYVNEFWTAKQRAAHSLHEIS